MTFFRGSELLVTEMLPGVRRTAVWQENLMLTFFEFDPRAVVPEHSHSNEQITVVVRGAMEFSLDGEIRRLGPGDGVCIAPGVPHSAQILEERTVAYDAWNPVREDYKG